MWVYKRASVHSQYCLIGFIQDGFFEVVETEDNIINAAQRVNYLNGGNGYPFNAAYHATPAVNPDITGNYVG